MAIFMEAVRVMFLHFTDISGKKKILLPNVIA